jgi:hypothetical protein
MHPRRGHDSKLIEVNGHFIGVDLGRDFTTEHECGIGPLKALFGGYSTRKDPHNGFHLSDFESWKATRDERRARFLGLGRFFADPPPPPTGLARRKITRVPEAPVFMATWFVPLLQSEKTYGLAAYRNSDSLRVLHRFAEKYPDRDLVTAWSDESFVVIGRSDATRERLTDLASAIVNLNVVIGSVNSRYDRDAAIKTSGGLCLLIADRVPSIIVEDWRRGDEESFNSERLLDETGIKDFLAQHDKRFYALTRYHASDDGVWRAWLNPCEQHLYDAGWYTIDELRAWAKDEGPVVKGVLSKPRRKRA